MTEHTLDRNTFERAFVENPIEVSDTLVGILNLDPQWWELFYCPPGEAARRGGDVDVTFGPWIAMHEAWPEDASLALTENRVISMAEDDILRIGDITFRLRIVREMPRLDRIIR